MKTLFTHSCWFAISSYLLASAISASAEVGNIIHRVHPLTTTELIESSPAIGPDGTVYFTTRDGDTSGQMLGTIYAVNGTSGQIIANPSMNKIEAHGIMSSPTVGPDGAVVVGNGNRITKSASQLSIKVWDSDVFQPGGGKRRNPKP